MPSFFKKFVFVLSAFLVLFTYCFSAVSYAKAGDNEGSESSPDVWHASTWHDNNRDAQYSSFLEYLEEHNYNFVCVRFTNNNFNPQSKLQDQTRMGENSQYFYYFYVLNDTDFDCKNLDTTFTIKKAGTGEFFGFCVYDNQYTLKDTKYYSLFTINEAYSFYGGRVVDKSLVKTYNSFNDFLLTYAKYNGKNITSYDYKDYGNHGNSKLPVSYSGSLVYCNGHKFGDLDDNSLDEGVRILNPQNNAKVYVKNYGGSKKKVFQIPVKLECKIPIDFDMTTAGKFGWVVGQDVVPYYTMDSLTSTLNKSLFIETYAQDKYVYKNNPKFTLDDKTIETNYGLNRFSGPRDFAKVTWLTKFNPSAKYMHYAVDVLLDVDCSSDFKFNVAHNFKCSFSAPTKVTFGLLGAEFSKFKTYESQTVSVIPQVHVDLNKDGVDDRDGSQIGDNDCVDTKNKDGTGVDTVTGDDASDEGSVYDDKDTVSVDDINDTNFFSKLSKFVKSVGGVSSSIGDFINCIFGVFPSPIPELMISAFVIMILMTLIHFIRG